MLEAVLQDGERLTNQAVLVMTTEFTRMFLTSPWLLSHPKPQLARPGQSGVLLETMRPTSTARRGVEVLRLLDEDRGGGVRAAAHGEEGGEKHQKSSGVHVGRKRDRER